VGKINSGATKKLSFSLQLNSKNPYKIFCQNLAIRWKCCCHRLSKSKNVTALPVPYQNREPLWKRQVALVGIKCLVI